MKHHLADLYVGTYLFEEKKTILCTLQRGLEWSDTPTHSHVITGACGLCTIHCRLIPVLKY